MQFPSTSPFITILIHILMRSGVSHLTNNTTFLYVNRIYRRYYWCLGARETNTGTSVGGPRHAVMGDLLIFSVMCLKSCICTASAYGRVDWPVGRERVAMSSHVLKRNRVLSLHSGRGVDTAQMTEGGWRFVPEVKEVLSQG